jgi:hypothetical protein
MDGTMHDTDEVKNCTYSATSVGHMRFVELHDQKEAQYPTRIGIIMTRRKLEG